MDECKQAETPSVQFWLTRGCLLTSSHKLFLFLQILSHFNFRRLTVGLSRNRNTKGEQRRTCSHRQILCTLSRGDLL